MIATLLLLVAFTWAHLEDARDRQAEKARLVAHDISRAVQVTKMKRDTRSALWRHIWVWRSVDLQRFRNMIVLRIIQFDTDDDLKIRRRRLAPIVNIDVKFKKIIGFVHTNEFTKRLRAANVGPHVSFAYFTSDPDSISCFDNRRLLEPIGNMPSVEAEANYYAALEQTKIAA